MVVHSPWEQLSYLLLYVLPQFLGVLAIVSAFFVALVGLWVFLREPGRRAASLRLGLGLGAAGVLLYWTPLLALLRGGLGEILNPGVGQALAAAYPLAAVGGLLWAAALRRPGQASPLGRALAWAGLAAWAGAAALFAYSYVVGWLTAFALR